MRGGLGGGAIVNTGHKLKLPLRGRIGSFPGFQSLRFACSSESCKSNNW